MGRVVLKPSVQRDLVEHFAYIGEASGEDSARRFLRNAYQRFDQLAELPLIGPSRSFRNPKLTSVRMWRVRGFPKHLIYYRPRAGGVAILRVVHGARDLQRLFA